jgi:hypothetical protein
MLRGIGRRPRRVEVIPKIAHRQDRQERQEPKQGPSPPRIRLGLAARSSTSRIRSAVR